MIKKIAGILTGVVGVVVGGSAYATSTIVTLPENFASDALAYIGNLFTDLNPLILLLIGLPLAFWGVRKIITLVRVR